MAFTKKQKAAVKAIVSCHETGKPVGNYSALVVLKDDAGITYGSHQATHKSGSLHKIVQMYCNMSNSPVSKALDPYVAGFKNPALRHKYAQDTKLKNLLKAAGKEAPMRYAQDKVFEVNYFEPALRAVEGSKWTSPLALAVVYDSVIQGGWTKVRDRVKAPDEKSWIKAYVAARRRWLSSSKRGVVRNSVYRMKTFENLIARGNWNLDVPITVHGAKITDEHLAVWIATETPTREVVEIGEVATINVTPPSANYFKGNTEGIAEEESEAGGSWAEEGDEPIESVDPIEEPIEEPVENINEPDRGGLEEPVKAGEPAPDAPAQEGEAIVGGRPQDPPIIIEQKKIESASGWRTWPTTITATLSGLGLSVGGCITWISGVELSEKAQETIGWIVIVGLVIAAVYGLFYLITRSVTAYANGKRKHEIELKELELRSMPDRYNVKLDRRGDTSNLTESGLPIIEKRES